MTLYGMIEEEENGAERVGDKWRTFGRLIQAICNTGEISRQMMWLIIVLLPKGNGEYQGIGLMEPFTKVVELVVDARLQII